MGRSKSGLNWNFEHSYSKLPKHFFASIAPTQVVAPQLLIFNDNLAKELELTDGQLNLEEIALELSGNKMPSSAKPIAMAYAGHQFGGFNQLGDGRAHLLGEHCYSEGKRVDVQLKGSGPTPYSRRGDGRATLGPMLREYLISEAMYALGIPSTRSLAVVSTGETVYRGRPLPGAILTRIAASHIRFGTFEYLAAIADKAGLQQMVVYTLTRHYPELLVIQEPYLELLKAVMHRHINLIVDWMRVGFIHGVMNTDNMSLSGETIDYGPCAFMDNYHPNTVFSAIDDQGRYAFANQPNILWWNLARFAESLLGLIDEDLEKSIEKVKAVLDDFPALFKQQWLTMMRNKLGLKGEHLEDEKLINELLALMQVKQLDFTNTFIELMHPVGTPIEAWYQNWKWRFDLHGQCVSSMQEYNPFYIPRNHHVEQALSAAIEGDLKPYLKLLDLLQYPYLLREGLEVYQRLPQAHERVLQTFCGT
jgi:uncharacterized protein YdiU (UPF0061 family)